MSLLLLFNGGAAAPTNYQLTAQGGTYTLTGQQADITFTPAANYLLTAEGGTYSLTGSDATISRNRSLTAQGGAYSLTGADATIYRNRVLTASGGAYAIGGQSAQITRTYLYPDPADVRQGIIYGPGGIYTGTLVATSGATLSRWDGSQWVDQQLRYWNGSAWV